MKKLKFGFIAGCLAVCMVFAFSGAASASDYPGPKVYGEDWPERGWC
ncbi:hypothetical protein [Paenibacillus methanolicus]|uniref:Uncharacterized protein n=1 Tax=Paenibacillus methanolicus TaxID=582686 RepID=A0A5S5C0M9_9BACL|nr:hypothetical protein [Paenibacillus methanolicus]TYP72006.1 hypothetical protein BCM02_109285 [Paenibacillus methanolicus]